MERQSDSLARSATNPLDRNIGRYTSAAAQGYLALVRGDTAGALRHFDDAADSLCPYCYQLKLTQAQLLSAKKQDQKADQLLNRWLTFPSWPSEVLWTLERGRVAERLGKREKAAEAYQYVADVWRHADPELQPYVAEAKQGLARLTAER
jgi:predicted Zn-dependent protease